MLEVHPGITTLKARCEVFTRIPFAQLEDLTGIKNYYAVIDVDALFDLKKWREMNVRDARSSGYVPGRIRETLQNNELFPIINRGLVLHAKDVRWDNRTNMIELDLEDAEIHGLIDGGHTYLQLEQYKQEKQDGKRIVQQQFIKVEILTGLDHKQIVDVSDGRNTSTQVKAHSLEELKDTFEGIKGALKGRNYEHLISYSEYEVYEAGGVEMKKPVPVHDILKALVCFDKDSFDDQKHPVGVVTRDSRTLVHFKDHLTEMKPIYPILPDILRLWDTIGRDFVQCYRSAGGQAYRIGSADERFFRKLKKGSNHLYFLDAETEWSFAHSLRLPALAAFRAGIVKKGKDYRWDSGIDPCAFFSNVIGTKLTKVICGSLLDTQDPHRTSKTESVWQSCYDAVENAILKQR